MDTNPEIRERILAAANQLFEQSGRKELPTVDAVRKLSKTSMNDASAVMREWRRLQIVSASAAVVSVPERVSQASAAALSALWTEAQELANESLNVAQAAWDAERAEAEKLLAELGFEALQSERNRRLRAREFLRGTRKTALIGNRHEDPERTQFQQTIITLIDVDGLIYKRNLLLRKTLLTRLKLADPVPEGFHFEVRRADCGAVRPDAHFEGPRPLVELC